jgi:plastocyanin
VPHDLAAPELELAIPPVVVEGASASTVFSAPPTRGRYEYTCTLHQQMMRGIIQVGG